MDVATYAFPTRQEAEDAAVRIYNFVDVISIVIPNYTTDGAHDGTFAVAFCKEHEGKVRSFLQEGK